MVCAAAVRGSTNIHNMKKPAFRRLGRLASLANCLVCNTFSNKIVLRYPGTLEKSVNWFAFRREGFWERGKWLLTVNEAAGQRSTGERETCDDGQPHAHSHTHTHTYHHPQGTSTHYQHVPTQHCNSPHLRNIQRPAHTQVQLCV